MLTAQAAFTLAPHQARPGRGTLVARNLNDLQGPDHGVDELPVRLFWSADDRHFNVDDPADLQSMYEKVLRESIRPDELTDHLNGALLTKVWPELFLPRGVRQAWEDEHPALRRIRHRSERAQAGPLKSIWWWTAVAARTVPAIKRSLDALRRITAAA